VDGHPICATVSIGLVHSQGRTLDVSELLGQADHALYYAKERGRNRVEVASLDMMLERRDQASQSASPVEAESAA
jgi:predicted signal transduction protein with EAL and GGDEF domain